MKERPILFSAPMVRAILAGKKTQTRRVVKGKPLGWLSDAVGFSPDFVTYPENDACPYGQPGDRLWVREAWRADVALDKYPPRECAPNWPLWFEADGAAIRADRVANPRPGKLRPGMFMPRWASRITLEITDIRVARLQEISEEDARAEGAEPYPHPVHPARECLRHVDGFSALWESINGTGSWDANPWVWVIAFAAHPSNPPSAASSPAAAP